MKDEILRGTLAGDVDVVSYDKSCGECESTKHSITFTIPQPLDYDRDESGTPMYQLGQQLARLVVPVEQEFAGTYDDLVDGIIDWMHANRGDE
jgi:hypothetical protein